MANQPESQEDIAAKDSAQRYRKPWMLASGFCIAAGFWSVGIHHCLLILRPRNAAFLFELAMDIGGLLSFAGTVLFCVGVADRKNPLPKRRRPKLVVAIWCIGIGGIVLPGWIAQAWKSSSDSAESSSSQKGEQQQDLVEAGAPVVFNGPKGAYSVRYLSDSWVQSTQPHNLVADIELSHRGGGASAIIIAEPIEIPLDKLRDIAFTNLRAIAPDAKILEDGHKTLPGEPQRRAAYMVVNGSADGIPFTWFGYYYSGKKGSIQCLCATGQNLFEELKPDFEKLFGGIEFTD